MEKNSLRLNITEEDSRWSDSVSDLHALAEKIMQETFVYVEENDSLDKIDFSKPVNINLSLSDDPTVHELNKRYRGLDKATNVLSFAHLDDEDFAKDCAMFEEIDLGDIIIAYDTTLQEASQKQIPLRSHFAHLFTHGLLHILGFDHQEDDEAEYMESFETNILQNLGFPDPYRE